jgi:hypothetical protein
VDGVDVQIASHAHLYQWIVTTPARIEKTFVTSYVFSLIRREKFKNRLKVAS